MATLQQNNDFSHHLIWHGNCSDGDCVDFPLSGATSIIEEVYGFTSSGATSHVWKSNPTITNDFDTLECGHAYFITLKKGSGSITIPHAIVSNVDSGDIGSVVDSDLCLSCFVPTPTPTPTPPPPPMHDHYYYSFITADTPAGTPADYLPITLNLTEAGHCYETGLDGDWTDGVDTVASSGMKLDVVVTDPSIATYSDGYFTCHKVGTTTVTLTQLGGMSPTSGKWYNPVTFKIFDQDFSITDFTGSLEIPLIVMDYRLHLDSIPGIVAWYDAEDVDATGKQPPNQGLEFEESFNMYYHRISSWKDKSGNGHDLTQTDQTLMPRRVPSLGNMWGKPTVLVGPGVNPHNKLMHLTGPSMPSELGGNASWTIFVVASNNHAQTASTIFQMGSDTGTPNQIIRIGESHIPGQSETTSGPSISHNVHDQTYTTEDPYSIGMGSQTIMMYEWAGPGTPWGFESNVAGGPRFGFRMNGGQYLDTLDSPIWSKQDDVDIPTTDVETLLGIGRWNQELDHSAGTNEVSSFRGVIAEILVFDKNFGQSYQREKIEGYLAHKWNSEGSLPIYHPFRNQAPMWGGDQTISINFNPGNQFANGHRIQDGPFNLYNGQWQGWPAPYAWATSAQPVTLVSSDPSVLKVEQISICPETLSHFPTTKITPLQVGTVTITASQVGDSHFNPAPDVTVDVTVVT